MSRFEINKHSADWRNLKSYVDGEIESLRQQLETPGLEMQPTENLRGAIAALRKLVEAGEPSAPVLVPSDGYGLQSSN